MSLRINTNIAALNAHKSMVKNDNALSTSLERLSSGLRINKAADDASGMSIADSLKSQALGLGQAIKNANDGISMVQTADGALDESINIVNTIKTKAIQAAQDGQTTESRKAIQSDINKLLEELNNIAKTTAFNGQKLLSGNFTNKAFQIGAYSGETVSISIGSSESTKIGHVTTGDLTLDAAGGGTVALSIYSNLQGASFNIAPVDLQYNNSAENGMGALADAVNKLSDSLGIAAQAVVTSTSTNTVAAGTTGDDFAINGITIGQVTVADNDSTGTLVKAINNKSSDTGVVASVDGSGYLTLTSTDGRAIDVSGFTDGVLKNSDMSTFGYLRVNQFGSNALSFTMNGVATNFATALTIGASVTTSQDMTAVAGSTLAISSVLAAGTVFGDTIGLLNDVISTAGSTLTAGSSLASGDILKAGTVIGDDITGTVGTTTGVSFTAGSVLASDVTLTAAVGTTTADWYLATGSKLQAADNVAVGSYLGGDATLAAAITLTQDMMINSGSVLTGGTLQNGSTLGADITVGALTANSDISVSSGSVLAAASVLKAGTVLGQDMTGTYGATTTTVAAGTVLANDLTLTAANTLTSDLVLKAGSTIAATSVLAANDGTGASLANTEVNRLSDVSVLTQDSAQVAISVADAALQDLDKVRSGIGSVQNQLTSTIANISATQVNITAAESSIRDVDFADESATFSKMQILVQASTFAMAQANASSRNVLTLLQG